MAGGPSGRVRAVVGGWCQQNLAFCWAHQSYDPLQDSIRACRFSEGHDWDDEDETEAECVSEQGVGCCAASSKLTLAGDSAAMDRGTGGGEMTAESGSLIGSASSSRQAYPSVPVLSMGVSISTSSTPPVSQVQLVLVWQCTGMFVWVWGSNSTQIPCAVTLVMMFNISTSASEGLQVRLPRLDLHRTMSSLMEQEKVTWWNVMVRVKRKKKHLDQLLWPADENPTFQISFLHNERFKKQNSRWLLLWTMFGTDMLITKLSFVSSYSFKLSVRRKSTGTSANSSPSTGKQCILPAVLCDGKYSLHK